MEIWVFKIRRMLEVENLSFQYATPIKILSELSFRVQKGEILSILGESGSGKSTLLKLIYGLEDAHSGKIIYKNEKVTGPKSNLIPGHPAMKFVPQEFDLLDSIRVSENVGKYLSNTDLIRKKNTVLKALEVVEMRDYKNEYPSKLSGGQRQRVSIARALAAEPEVLLLDEPYSHLDQPLKFKIRKNLWNWAKEKQCTVILTTHDVNDAFGFSDKMGLLKEGEIVQMDSPENLRENPINEYVASILGDYSLLNSKELKTIFGLEIPKDKKIILYPEEISEVEEGVEFEVLDVRFRGRDYLVEAKIGKTRLWFYSKEKPINNSINLKINNLPNRYL